MGIAKFIRPKIVNTRMLLRIVGWLLMIEGLFMLIPVIVSLYFRESDWLAFLIPAVCTAFIGFELSHRIQPTSRHMGKRDGFLLTALVWVVFSLFGLVPFLLCNNPMNFNDAFFEAMSGFTTTGATVLANTEGMSHGVHIWRAMMQWIGGLGIILFTVAVIPMLNHSGGMQMFNAEVTGITHDKIRPRISQTAKMLWFIYIGLTIMLVMLLWAGPMTLFDSFCHAFGTISTGGYSSSSTGIAQWGGSAYVKLVLIVFMFIGGVNFSLIFHTVRGEFGPLKKNEVFRVYLKIIGLVFVLFVLSIVFNGVVNGWQSVTIDPLFQVVSTLTSTGYALPAFETWGSFVLGLTFVMMFFGACAGSTAGGAKIDRILYLFKNIYNEIYRCVYPNSVLAVNVNGRVVNPELVNKVVVFLCLYMLLVVAGGLSLSLLGVPVIDSFFSSFSCISNTGFGAGILGYGYNFELMPAAAKWILAFLMLVGRLEIYTVLVIFTPAFWRR